MIVNKCNEKIIKGKKSIFLAGPAPGKEKVKSWRIDAIQKLKEFGFDGVVYNPEYLGEKVGVELEKEILWQQETIEEATVILFWVPRNKKTLPGFTTNIEFGYWLNSGKIIYGRPDTAEEIGYLDFIYKQKYQKEPINNLDELVYESIKLCEKLYLKKRKKEDY
ncbi:MAG TPA: hypothetical protein GX690_02900 [Tenericutes bacterium]|nr:hypothetical protein [Mycoplasmatota bacterium]